MRALVVTEYTQPWDVTDMPDPAPGSGQVKICIYASGLCGTDLHLHDGHMPLPTPLVAGHEPTGEVVELGEGVTDLRVGDRVGVNWYQHGCGRCTAGYSGDPGSCPEVQTWMKCGGGNSELMVAWSDGCTLIPDGVSYEDAAPMFCAGFTAMSGLRNADPRPGERIAVLGVGGLGHLALQFASALGFETVAMTSQADKEEELLSLGAERVLVIGDEGPGEALQEAGGADVILPTTNSTRQISDAFGGLRERGRLVNMGVPDGPIVIDPSSLTSASANCAAAPKTTGAT